MYDNIGKKIKGSAIAIFIIGALACIIIGIVKIVTADDGLELTDNLLSLLSSYQSKEQRIFYGICILLLGPVLSWILSWALYGFGELIEKTCAIERNTRSSCTIEYTNSSATEDRLSRLKNLRNQGLISEEEYQQAIFQDRTGTKQSKEEDDREITIYDFL